MLHKITYSIFYSFTLFVIILPKSVRNLLFKGLARIAFYLFKSRVQTVYANLTLAFGSSLSDKEKKDIAKTCFENLFLEMLSVIETHFLSIDTLTKNFKFVGVEHIKNAHAQNRPIVFFTAHYNDLEMGGIALGLVAKTVHSVQQANNPYIDAFINKGRQKVGLAMTPMHKAMRTQARQLKNGGDVSMVVDQSINSVTVEFFGHKVKHVDSASRLTRKYDAVLIPSILHKNSKGNWQPTFYAPIPFTPTDDEVADIAYLTQAQAHFVENIIQDNPAPWFWCHKRFKDYYGHIYT